MEIILFILISIGLIIVPGPNVLVIMSTSISHGKIRGLQTVSGTSTAMLIQLIIAAIGTSWLVASLAEGFHWLKWIGVGYLFYLGVSNLFFQHGSETELSGIGSFHRGFWVSLTNPKTILFFSAFLPQFVTDQSSYYWQIIYLSSLFWLLAVVLDSGYAILASRLSTFLKGRKLLRMSRYTSGVLYLGAGTVLAATKNS